MCHGTAVAVNVSSFHTHVIIHRVIIFSDISDLHQCITFPSLAHYLCLTAAVVLQLRLSS